MKLLIFLIAATISFSAHAKKLICEKTESGMGQRIVEKKSDDISAKGAFISFASKLDSNIKLDGYYDVTNQMMGAHINDHTVGSSAGSYADISKEKAYAKVNYRKQTPQGMFLYVLECLEK